MITWHENLNSTTNKINGKILYDVVDECLSSGEILSHFRSKANNGNET
jgi:hypothetical protein